MELIKLALRKGWVETTKQLMRLFEFFLLIQLARP